MTNPKREIDLSIIIVNYNSGELLRNCLDSIFRHIQGNYEVIVYDNCSSDDSLLHVQNKYPDSFPLTLMPGDENLGFSKANNLAVQHSNGRYLHFLNPDVIVNGQLNQDYHEIVEGSSEGIWVTSLVDEEGRLLKNRHVIPRLKNFLNRLFQKSKVAYWNIGASLIMNRSAFDRLGGWNEDTFMYAEDLELFYQAYLNRIPVFYLDTKIVHIGKGSTQHLWNEQERARVVEESFFKFYKRHGVTWEYFLVRPVMLMYLIMNEPRQFSIHFNAFCQRCFKCTE